MQNLLPIKLFCEEYNVERFMISTDFSFNFQISTGMPKMSYQSIFVHINNGQQCKSDEIQYDPDTCPTELKNIKDWVSNPEFFNSLRSLQHLYETTPATEIQKVYNELHTSGIPFIDATWRNFLYNEFNKQNLFKLMKILKCDTLVDLTMNSTLAFPFSDLGLKINNKVYYLDSNNKLGLEKNEFYLTSTESQSEIIYPTAKQKQLFYGAADELINLNNMISINELTIKSVINILKYYKINFEH